MASDALFSRLPKALQKRINSAFNSVAHRTKYSPPAAGGFFPESGGFLQDEQDDLHGGFIPGDGGGFMQDNHEESAPARIPLSMIPSALQILDLPPDDEQVLAVFRNAATGWTSSDNTVDAYGTEAEDYVSRDDWCSVCAVLLEHDAEGDNNMNDDVEMAKANDSPSDTDEYHESVEESGDNDDSDYMENPSASTRRRTRQTRKSSSSLSPPPASTSPGSKTSKLTPRQRQVCMDTYALFFPSSPPDKLLDQRIMIKDIQRAAKLLNEKLKAEEMLEMLETFSTSPDKSMNFDDFCRMMISAKLA